VGTRTPYWWEEVAARLGGAAQQVVAELKTVPDRERIARLENLRLEGGTIESDTNLTSDDLLVLENANIEVGNHTVTHPILDRCPIEKITHEIRAAATELAEILGRPIRAFAYPNGSWNPAVREAVADAGHLVAFLFDHREQVWPVPDPLTISRIRVNSTDPIEEFAIRVSGLHSTMMHVRSRLG
jgi:peptidoglycan/xylan/chitin deacetylase (PgdA/CDA1 family)